MYEILKTLPAGSYVLDLGCADGSFRSNATAATVIRADRDAPRHTNDDKGALRVQADAANLPFVPVSFTAVISNHSLEHFDALDDTLREIARIISRDGGSLFVAVPDSSTLTDIIYRWLARGGGHVNAFTSAKDLARTIQNATGLPHVSTRVLCSSLSFLNRRNAPRPMPRRAMLLGAGYEWSLFAYAFLSRRLDRLLGWRTSVYGWALYSNASPTRLTYIHG